MNKKQKLAEEYIVFLKFLIDIKDNQINYYILTDYRTKKNDSSLLHFQSYVLSLYSIFQKYLCKLFRIQLKKFSNLYFSEKDIKFSELTDFQFKKNKIIDHLIEGKINNFTRGVSDIKNLCANLGIKNEGCFNELKYDYEEFCCRRNIYAHGIDYITEEYKKANIHLINSWLKGDALIESKEYVESCTNLIYKMFFQIYFELNIVNQKAIDLGTLVILEQTIYKHFYAKKSWDVPKYFYKRLKNLNTPIKKQNTLLYRQMYYVNYLFCEKKLGMDIKEKGEKMVFKYEKDKFEIARDALNEDYKKLYDDFIKLQNKQVKLSLKVTRQNLQEWTIFEDFRKTEYYLKLIGDERFI